MKKRIITIAVCCLILILPTIVAIISYSYAQSHPITPSSVSSMILKTPDGKEVSVDKKNDKALFDCFIEMNDKAEAVPNLLDSINQYKSYTVEYRSYNRKLTYTYFFSTESTNAFYRDPNGDYYRIDASSAGTFLTTPYAASIFPAAVQPSLTVGNVSLLPSEIDWNYRGYDDRFYAAAVNTQAEEIRPDVNGGLQLSFNRFPDHLYVELVNPEGETVYQDVYEKLDSSFFTDNILYTVKLTAKWYEAEGRDSYGEATYSFKANVLSPAVFYMSQNDMLRYGDFVIISAKNIVDSSKIGFTSTPSIDFTPVFFEYGGYYHALVPISLAMEAKNNGVLDYSFRLTYGDVSQELTVKLTKRAIARDYQNISADEVANKRNETTMKIFEETMKAPLMLQNDELYWMTDNKLIKPLERNIRTGFGLEVILSNAGTSYTHEGVNYYVFSGDAVLSCLPGKVTYVGETTLSGITVVVDHGGGLKSMYAHLSATSVKVGDHIQKGRAIGIVGNTGFCTGTTLHFGLYVFNVPVRYYNYETDGVSLAEPVAKALGLIPDSPAV